MLNQLFQSILNGNKSHKKHPFLKRGSTEATILENINPNQVGRAKFRGSFWRVKCNEGIILKEKQLCSVIDIIESTTLIVEPIG